MSKHAKSRRTKLRVEELGERIAPAAGGPDGSFGIDGKVSTPIGPGDANARAVAIDSLGRIVVAGYASDGTDVDFTVVRYNADGTLDTAFDGDGKVTTPIGAGGDICTSVAVDSVGRIVASGHSFNGVDFDFAVVRYNPDGSLDNTFATDGIVTTSFGFRDDVGNSAALDSTGRIVVGGHAFNGSNYDFAVARYNVDGTLDTTFDGDGRATTAIYGSDDFGYALAVDSTDRIIVAGSSFNGNDHDSSIARFNVDGSLDSTFDGDGKASIPIAGIDDGNFGMTLDPNDRIIVVGRIQIPGNVDFLVSRYDVNGQLDATLDFDGVLGADFYSNNDSGQDAVVDSAGRIVVVGYTQRGSDTDIAIVRFLDNGILDTSFDVDGETLVSFGTGLDYGLGVSLDSLGRIVVVGENANNPNSQFAVARLEPEDFRIGQSDPALTYLEGDGAQPLDATLALQYAPNTTILSATVRVDHYRRSEDTFDYTLAGGIIADFNSLDGVLTLSGTANVADYQSVLRSLTYTNTSQHPDELSRSVLIEVDGGATISNLQPINESATTTYTIRVLAVNDAPSFTADGQLGAILTGNTNPPGQKISALFKGEFFDADGDTLTGIAVIANLANAATEGTWQYSTDNGTTWFNIGTVADDAMALALVAKTRIRFVPVAGYAGRPTPLGVRAIDSTNSGPFTVGAIRQTIDTTNRGGTRAISEDPANIETQVFPVGTGGNTAPTLHDVPVSANFNGLEMYTFDASATDPDVGQDLTFRLAGAPSGASIDPDTGEFAWTPTEVQGPDTFVFNVVVSDGFVETTQYVTLIVREVNLAPTLGGVPATATLVRGQTLQFTATTTDPDILNGLGNAFTYSLVDAPAGATIDPDTGVFSWTPTDSNLAGIYSFRVRVVDDGVPSKSDTKSIDVTLTPAAVVNGDLIVGGTSANDVITVTPSGNRLVVTLNRRTIASVLASDVTGRILVRGLDGADRITVSTAITKPSELRGDAGNDSLVSGAGNDSLYGGLGNDTLKAGNGTNLLDGGEGNDSLVGGGNTDRLFGGPGDDRISGGAGNNLLVGGTGNDLLTGGAGRDVMLGGAGQDKLTGGAGEDLLLAGSTSFDNDPTSFDNIFAEWTSASTYADRISHLTGTAGGLNGATQINATTVQVDGIRDTLTGGTNLDWYIHSTGDLLVGALATETKTVV